MPCSSRHAVCVLTFLLPLSAAVPAATAEQGQWARFRGPNGAGISDANAMPVRWSEADYKWTVRLPGTGHGSPVVWQGRVFLTCTQQRTATRMVLCLAASDGRELWRKEFRGRPHKQHKDNSYASSTPAVDAENVCVTWATPKQVTLLALDHDGEQKWRRDLGPLDSMHGSGNSPIIYKDLVVLPNDQQGKAFLIAVDRRTGKTRWQVPRRSALTPASTPCVFRLADGRDTLVFTTTAHGISGVDPATGRTVWEIPDVFLDRCVGSPICAGRLVIASFGFGRKGTRLVAVRPDECDAKGRPRIAWDLKRSVPLVPTSLVKDGRAFLWSDDGTISCMDAPTGKLIWRHRVKGEFYSSPICVAGRLYCITKKGEVVVIAAAGEFKLLGRTPLGEPTYATPAVADGTMYLRTRTRLMALGRKKK